jgi:hypothetical protein
MGLGKIGGNLSPQSIPDLDQLDSDPNSVALATGKEGKLGRAGQRVVQLIHSGLEHLSDGVKHAADSFAHVIESQFAGVAKDQFKSLFSRNPRKADSGVELKSFKAGIDAIYAEISDVGVEASRVFENSVYSEITPYKDDVPENQGESIYDVPNKHEKQQAAKDSIQSYENPTYSDLAGLGQGSLDITGNGEYSSVDDGNNDYLEIASDADREPTYASLSDLQTRNQKFEDENEYIEQAPRKEVQSGSASGKGADYVNVGENEDLASRDYQNFSPIYENISSKRANSEYDIPKSVVDRDLEAFVSVSSKDVDAKFYSRVDSNSPESLKKAAAFVKLATLDKGTAAGDALEAAGILRYGKVIGQITPELFSKFNEKLSEIIDAREARKAEGFALTEGQLKFEKFNSENADAPIHELLKKPIFDQNPKWASKIILRYDQTLARGSSALSPKDTANSEARLFIGESIKESFESFHADSPIRQFLARSSLSNSASEKLSEIRESYDLALLDAAKSFAFQGGFLDKSLDLKAFKRIADTVALDTITKYTI